MMNKLIIPSIIAFILYLCVIVYFGLSLSSSGISFDFSKSGQFGDSFGFLSAMMAGLAAYAAWSAYSLQTRDIEELRKNEKQRQKSLDKRDFEQTFFNIFELFRQMVREIEYHDFNASSERVGRDALTGLFYQIDSEIHLKINKAKKIKSSEDLPLEDTLSIFGESYRKIYFSYKDDLGVYFRIFYHILRYVEESPIENKMFYTRILRANLSNTEMCLIALNCIYGGGQDKLKPLVEKYQMLHNISAKSAQTFYFAQSFSSNAFGSRVIDGYEHEIDA